LDTEQSYQWETQEMGALGPVNRLGTNTYTADAKIIRDKLKDYFSAEGATSFQYEKLFNL